MKVFKIRKKGTTDTFSSGGADPRWTTKGKTWASLGHVKNHLSQVVQPRSGGWRPLPLQANYAEAEVVEYDVVVASTTDVATILLEIHDKAQAKRDKAEAAARKAREDREKEELRRLQAKYPNG
jgi:hypothetical protein